MITAHLTVSRPNTNSAPTTLARVRYARGQTAVIVALVLVTLLGAMALGTDVAVMYLRWVNSQKAVDSAALAGANYLNGGITPIGVASQCLNEPDDAQKAACTYIVNNGFDPKGLTMWEPGQNLPAGAKTPNIQVWEHSTVPAFFGALLGLTNYNIATIATAYSSAPVQTVNQGMFPMAVQCCNPCSLSCLNPGSTTQFGMKFSPTGGASGNWQWLALGATGDSQLGTNVRYGVSGSYTVTQPISTEPGNDANSGVVKTAFSSRMASCPSIADPCNGTNPNNIPTGDPCLVAVPLVNFNGCVGSCTMPIEGFINVYIEPSSTSTNINACFIRAVTGNSVAGGPSTTNVGALSPPILIQ